MKDKKEDFFLCYAIGRRGVTHAWGKGKTQEEAIWKCSHCSAANEDWEIYCMNCKSFDSIKFNAKKLENNSDE